MEWITAHYGEVCAALIALQTFATLVVKLTPTQKDDAILAKVIGALSFLSFLKPKAKV